MVYEKGSFLYENQTLLVWNNKCGSICTVCFRYVIQLQENFRLEGNMYVKFMIMYQ